MVPAPPVLVSCGHLPFPRLTESETQELGSQNLCFEKLSKTSNAVQSLRDNALELERNENKYKSVEQIDFL